MEKRNKNQLGKLNGIVPISFNEGIRKHEPQYLMTNKVKRANKRQINMLATSIEATSKLMPNVLN